MPARRRTDRCFVTAGSDTVKGAASWDTEASPCARRATIARRVGSARAAKMESRPASEPLTIWLSMGHTGPLAQGACRSEEHTSELQSRENLVCRLLLEKK